MAAQGSDETPEPAPPAGPAGGAADDRAGEGKSDRTWRVRRAARGDVAAMDAMVHELAEYEKAPELVEATPADLEAALFGGAPTADGDGPEPPVTHAHVAEVRDEHGQWQVAGMAVWFVTYSTWTGRHGIWLEDLYVRPASRRLGLGRALLAALAHECLERGYRRLEWTVLDWNTPAQEVYRAIGGRPQEEWTTWRVDGEALTRLGARG